MFSGELDLIHMISNSGPVVNAVLFLLLGFSIACWTIIIVKYRYIRKAFQESALFTDFFWKSRDLAEAYARAKQLQGSPIAQVFRIGYIELKKVSQSGAMMRSQGQEGVTPAGLDNVKRALRRAINTELTRMTQMIPFLATTGNTAPFIGLFGTVWGIMNSFHGIGLRGSATLAVVAPGISEALVATAAGLAAAIPAVIAYNYFNQKIKIIETELIGFSADFLNIIERDLISVKGSAS
uniref:Protein TolQ n=1 Tax=Desulfatirhabdium butyrativorans TaxID=340467 RepID=A0A7C4RIE3_9BACT